MLRQYLIAFASLLVTQGVCFVDQAPKFKKDMWECVRPLRR